MVTKYGEEKVAQKGFSHMDRILEESWNRKFPEYKLHYEKHRDVPFQITLKMYFLFKFAMRTYETEKEKKTLNMRIKQLARNTSILNTIPPNPITLSKLSQKYKVTLFYYQPP
jgi:hypothetical protein